MVEEEVLGCLGPFLRAEMSKVWVRVGLGELVGFGLLGELVGGNLNSERVDWSVEMRVSRVGQ